LAFDKTEWIARWQGLSQRERLLGVSSLVLVLGALFHAVLYAPLQDKNAKQQQQLQAQQALFQHLQAVATKARALQPVAAHEPVAEPSALIDTTLAARSLQTAVIRQVTTIEGQFDFMMEAVDFNAWVQWLAELHGHGFAIKTLDIQRSEPNAAKIRGRLSLIQPGAVMQ